MNNRLSFLFFVYNKYVCEILVYMCRSSSYNWIKIWRKRTRERETERLLWLCVYLSGIISSYMKWQWFFFSLSSSYTDKHTSWYTISSIYLSFFVNYFHVLCDHEQLWVITNNEIIVLIVWIKYNSDDTLSTKSTAKTIRR
jgi:hypothetical protein